jgi:hypothetical protein
MRPAKIVTPQRRVSLKSFPPGVLLKRLQAYCQLVAAIDNGFTGNPDADAFLREIWDEKCAALDRERRRDADRKPRATTQRRRHSQ